MPLKNLQGYFAYLCSPWGEMVYRLTWEQLDFAHNLRVLDFGSGTGKTANHLAKQNEVTAVEPSADMLAHRCCDNHYTQIHGGIDALPNAQFDLVTCHNVLEFADDRARYLAELARRVKPGGKLSVVKHNMPGKVLRQAAGYNDPTGALALLQGSVPTNPFGAVQVYDTREFIAEAAAHGLALERCFGIRTFYALRGDNDGWDDPAWGEAAHGLEQAAAELEPYRSMAFYHHVILCKT